MAEVWRARAYGMAGFEKILVIKRVLESLSKDDDFVKLFIHEARIAVQLHHANIVQVLTSVRSTATTSWPWNMCRVPTLPGWMKLGRSHGPMPVGIALFIVSEVLKALQYAHARKGEDEQPLQIVHCDISPQNILISQAGEVKITDFGIARAAVQADPVHEVVRGKYAYMSPEQLDGATVDSRSDLFSLGAVLYEMLTGNRLYASDSKEGVLAKVSRSDVPSPRALRPSVSEPLDALVMRLLHHRANDRFQNAQEVLEAISGLMVEESHRVNNAALSNYVGNLIGARPSNQSVQTPKVTASAKGVVVLAAQAFEKPKTLATPSVPIEKLASAWTGFVRNSGGEIWEHVGGSMLACWADGELDANLNHAIEVGVKLRKWCHERGYQVSAGIAPGVAQLRSDTGRPPTGWELAGPFYLARWMMNLSAHRGRILLTETGARKTKGVKKHFWDRYQFWAIGLLCSMRSRPKAHFTLQGVE